ncbi:hypothetical protein GQ54DRAFT_308718 [Martensiomyces pterosporus]|nr:hypothetical protein GQ54DRAFT_308718 [Martensiomyces pterosporus]
MEIWLASIVCVLLVLFGSIIGGLTVYLVSRCHWDIGGSHGKSEESAASKRAGVEVEEYETQMTAAERSVMHRISCSSNGVSLPLRLPDPCLRLPFPAMSSAYRMQHSQSSLSLAGSINALRRTHGPETRSEAGFEAAQTVDAADCAWRNEERPTKPAGTEETESQPDAKVGSPRSIRLAVRPATSRGTPAAVVMRPKISWSTPIDDRHRPPPARAPTSEHQLPKEMSCSFDEDSLGITSCSTAPSSPVTLASPCGSSEFIFVPPSPSCSSLFEISGSDTLSHPPLSSAFRAGNLSKSPSSPSSTHGCAMPAAQAVTCSRKYYYSRCRYSLSKDTDGQRVSVLGASPTMLPGAAAVV